MGLRAASLEAVRTRQEGGIEGGDPSFAQRVGMAEVDAVRGHVADARVTVPGVVPSEERAAMSARVLDAAEACREVRTVLHRLELRLRVRVIVGDVGPAMAPGDIQLDEQCGDWL